MLRAVRRAVLCSMCRAACCTQGNVVLTDNKYEVLTLLRSHRDDEKGFAVMARHPYPMHAVRVPEPLSRAQLEEGLAAAGPTGALKGTSGRDAAGGWGRVRLQAGGVHAADCGHDDDRLMHARRYVVMTVQVWIMAARGGEEGGRSWPLSVAASSAGCLLDDRRCVMAWQPRSPAPAR